MITPKKKCNKICKIIAPSAGEKDRYYIQLLYAKDQCEDDIDQAVGAPAI